MKNKHLHIIEIIFSILLILSILFNNTVSADTLQIEDSTEYNYYIDLRLDEYKIGRTLIQDSIITTTCAYLPNSYGCGIQVPLKTPFNMVKDKEYEFTILVITDGHQVQPSTWKSNINFVSVNDATPTKGVWRMFNYDTTENTTYNATFNVELQENNIYKLTYKLKSKSTQTVKYITYAFGESFSGDSTTGTLSFQYFMVDATNQEIVDAVKDLNNTIKDDSVPQFDQDKFLGYLPENALSSILNLPLNIINNVISALNSSTCTPLNLPIPYLENKTYQLECVSTLYEKMGVSTIVNFIGTLLGAFMLYNYLIDLYKWVDATLTFRENNWEGYD